MTRYLIASLLVVGLTIPAFAAKPSENHLAYSSAGHPDPCWSLRLQRHRSSAAESRFEACLARYNYND